jgi:hypothetical protein
MKFRRHALQVRWKSAAKSLRTNSVSLGMVYLLCIWIKDCRIPSVKVAFCQAEMRTPQLQNIQRKCHDAAVLTSCWKVLLWIYMKIFNIHVTLHFSKVIFFPPCFRSQRVQESLSSCIRFWLLLMLQPIVLDFDHVYKWRSSTLCHYPLVYNVRPLKACLTFWHRSFIFNSNKSTTWCNNFQFIILTFVYSSTCFGRFSRQSSGAQWLQWQLLVLHSYRGDSRAVFVVGPAGRSYHEHSPTNTTIRRENQRLPLQSLSSWWWVGKMLKHVEL